MVVAIKHSSKLGPQSLQVNDQRVVGTPMAGGSIVYKSVVVQIVLVVGSW